MKKSNFTLSETESRKLLSGLTQRDFGKPATYNSHRNGLIGSLLLDAGLRVGELTLLAIDDLTAACGPSRILALRPEITKTKKPREIPLTPTLANQLMTFLPFWQKKWNSVITEWAFPGINPYKHITTRQIRRIIGQAGRVALDINIHPHQLRHTFATRLLRHTNIRIVQKLLGHKSLTSTQIYTHPSTDDCREAIDNLGKKALTGHSHGKDQP